MNGCAAAASALTELVTRLGSTYEALVRQSRMPESDFGGLSGDAFRDHASVSADTVAQVASDLALLAGALANLGRELDTVAELRTRAETRPPDRTAQERARADDQERRAQADWRTAVAGYEE